MRRVLGRNGGAFGCWPAVHGGSTMVAAAARLDIAPGTSLRVRYRGYAFTPCISCRDPVAPDWRLATSAVVAQEPLRRQSFCTGLGVVCLLPASHLPVRFYEVAGAPSGLSNVGLPCCDLMTIRSIPAATKAAG